MRPLNEKTPRQKEEFSFFLPQGECIAAGFVVLCLFGAD
jgi:hypothetical protein